MQDHWQISWLVFFFFCYLISESFTIKFLSSDEVIDMFMYRVISFEYLVQSRSFELCFFFFFVLCFCVRYGMLRLYDQGYVRTCFPSLFNWHRTLNIDLFIR